MFFFFTLTFETDVLLNSKCCIYVILEREDSLQIERGMLFLTDPIILQLHSGNFFIGMSFDYGGIITF